MKVCQKQIKNLLLFSLLIFFLVPIQVLANEDGMGKGKMQMKTDRILQDPKNENNIVETELDKTFPELFEEETREKIETQQTELQAETTRLKNHIFEEKIPETTSLYSIKNELFTDDYSSQRLGEEDQKHERSNNPISQVLFYGSLATFIAVIGGGVFMLLRNIEL